MRAAEIEGLLIYDGKCGFCRGWAERWRAWTGERIRLAPLQQPGLLEELGIPKEDALHSVQFVHRNHRYQGAEAVFRALEQASARKLSVSSLGLRLISRICLLPGVRSVAEWGYRWVANRVHG